MGTFYQTIKVLSKDGSTEIDVEALVDTGSTYLWLPGEMLLRLGYESVVRRPLTVATGEPLERELAPVLVRFRDETWPVPCVFGNDPALALFGAVALEAFGLGVDPVNQRLVPVPALAL